MDGSSVDLDQIINSMILNQLVLLGSLMKPNSQGKTLNFLVL